MIDANCPCHGSTLDRLLRPALLFCLEEEAQHGYQIAQRLKTFRMFKVAAPDLTGLYRCLHDLESQGLVVRKWDAPAKGKARRQFSITSDGSDCLRQWESTLAEYAAAIEDLRRRLRGGGAKLSRKAK